MKNPSFLKHLSVPTLFLVFPLLTGCKSTRTPIDVVMGGAGAAIGHEISDGDPWLTAAGAAGGVLVSEGLHYAARKQAERAYRTGYEKGRSDAVKQQYWMLVDRQKIGRAGTNVRLYEIPLPEQTIDGAILKPTTKYLRIEE